MYSVNYINLGYSAQQTFATLEAAIDYGKKACFEFSVTKDGQTLAWWSPIGGLKNQF